MKVLVIDDNETSRRIFEEMLAAFSFDVTLAESATQGIKTLIAADAHTPFDLVVMDWKMPEMDGIEASQRIKGQIGLNRIPPIILVTAYPREEIMQRAEAIGLNGFLIKPVNSSLLFDAIMHVFKIRSADEEKPAGQADAPGDGRRPLEKARVLLVEDNEINQQVAREILESTGLIVSVAGNGQEAVEAAQKNHYDAILMDIQMPIMDGYTASQEIRKLQSEMRKVPLIAMTAHAMAGDEKKSLDAGMNDHVTKPIDPDQLFATLEKWIAPASARASDQNQPAADARAEPLPAVPENDTLPESLPGFDLREGLKRLQGNRTLYRKLIISFAGSCRETLDTIRSAAGENDFVNIRHLAHSLKGSAGNLAADEVHAAAMALEKLVGKNADTVPSKEDLARCLEQLDSKVDNVLASAARFGAAVKTAASGNGDDFSGIPEGKREALAKRLITAAEIGDIVEFQAIANELEDEFGDQQLLSRRILELADAFDLENIVKLAEQGFEKSA